MPIILDSIEDMDKPIYTPREKTLLHKLRILLKDVPDDVYRSLNTLVEEQRGERWSDVQLMVYLDQGIADINAAPPLTIYDLNNFPNTWEACVLNGALVFALIAEGILQNGLFLKNKNILSEVA